MKRIFIIFWLLITVPLFSQKISNLYDKLNGAVVLIKTNQQEILGEGDIQALMNLKGVGSGFVISEKGDIITASHLVQTAEQIFVMFSDGEEIPAKVVYSYPMSDVALIRLDYSKSTPLQKVNFGNSDKLKTGEQIFIIGAPYGLGNSLSVGYVSGKYTRKHLSSGFVITEFFQTDAAINKGSSGAPVFNMKGEVVGIASFILSRTEGFQGLGFAITSNIANNFLLKEKAVWTGIDGQLIIGKLAEILNLPQEGGVLVQKVVSGSLGDLMDIKGGTHLLTIEDEKLVLGGDVILSIEGIPLTSDGNLIKSWYALNKLKSGDSFSYTILRKGKVMSLEKIFP
ncbi:serine protease Do [Tenacibaculum adriaticum]|uniref:Serine protease Do n=1 Tax=Tenacibaculum adriaticum TaxID=413713 RepID=A0A5S5DT81_9FLAO|nr:trypsin-like peptidase domain-containing protein [Tenacibaculum adriaticum]TYP98985.1 serine protease Do [Tenacibaculum adriaticum]